MTARINIIAHQGTTLWCSESLYFKLTYIRCFFISLFVFFFLFQIKRTFCFIVFLFLSTELSTSNQQQQARGLQEEWCSVDKALLENVSLFNFDKRFLNHSKTQSKRWSWSEQPRQLNWLPLYKNICESCHVVKWKTICARRLVRESSVEKTNNTISLYDGN